MAEQAVSQEQPTLDDVYRKFDVDKMANDFATSQPQPQTQPQPEPQAPVSVPDPVTDAEAFRRFMGQDHQNRLALRQTLQKVEQQLTAHQQEQARKTEEADIKRAVEIVNADLKADPDMVEVALGAKARKDPKFLKLYEMRHKNPDAWDAALKAYSSELEGKFAMRADPQLVENQRAMKAAQQSMATGAKAPSKSDELGKLPMHELDRELDKMTGKRIY